jgi:hypothetical protein
MMGMRLARLFSPNARYLARIEQRQLSALGIGPWMRWNAMLANAWARDRTGRRHYESVTADELRAARRSDTVFVFGSGYSLNDITAAEWERIAEHDTFGFNAFWNQCWVDVGFYLIRGAIYDEPRWRPFAEQTAEGLRASPQLADTIYLLQSEFLGQFANQLVGYELLPGGSRLFRYHTSRESGLPERTFAAGIKHEAGTLTDVVHCAYCIGWTTIVLVGVDLYDNRYFWLEADATLANDAATARVVPAKVNNVRNLRWDATHNTVRNGIVEIMGGWAQHFARVGVRLEVWNPRSLLADVLPVYGRPGERALTTR